MTEWLFGVLTTIVVATLALIGVMTAFILGKIIFTGCPHVS